MAHDHQHDHGSHTANTRRLSITLALVVIYMGIEVVGGLAADSLALLADAGHMLSDAGALALTLFAMRFARRPATAQRTFGLYRAEILAALANGATLVAVAIYIFGTTSRTSSRPVKPGCAAFKRAVTLDCDKHDIWSCPDVLIASVKKGKGWGFIIHDGGSSYIEIKFCPPSHPISVQLLGSVRHRRTVLRDSAAIADLRWLAGCA